MPETHHPKDRKAHSGRQASGKANKENNLACAANQPTPMAQAFEGNVAYSVSELIGMARALSEGDFDRQFEQHCHGELGRLATYLEVLRQNLKVLLPSVSSSAYLIPQAAKSVAEISQQAEVGVNSILEVVEEMLVDQERVAGLLERGAQGEALDLPQLQSIAERDRQRLMNLISRLSFQDVIRQRAEKVQEMIDALEKAILELLLKFKVKINEQVIKEGAGREVLREEVKDLSQDMGLDQALVDELLENLG
jgi:HAMP domain-containing protein